MGLLQHQRSAFIRLHVLAISTAVAIAISFSFLIHTDIDRELTHFRAMMDPTILPKLANPIRMMRTACDGSRFTTPSTLSGHDTSPHATPGQGKARQAMRRDGIGLTEERDRQGGTRREKRINREGIRSIDRSMTYEMRLETIWTQRQNVDSPTLHYT